MRRAGFAAAISIMIAANAPPPTRADALTLAVPSALSTADSQPSMIQDVAYICHRWWQWRGARWIRSCWQQGRDKGWHGPGWHDPGWFEPAWNAPDWQYQNWR
jgi:hypothetical protein